MVGAQPPQRVGEEVGDRLRARVDAAEAAVGAAQRAELDADQRLAALARRQRVADQQLVVAHPVEVAGVEQRHAGVERGMDRRDALGVLDGRVGARHAHAAEADRADRRAAGAEPPLARARSSAQRLDGVEHGLGDGALVGRGRRRCSPSAVTIVTALRSESKPIPGSRDVVADDRVEPLALELRAGPLERALAVLGGEADERLARRAGAPRAPARTSAVGSSVERQRAVAALVDLARRAASTGR